MPEFEFLEPRCQYERFVRAWIYDEDRDQEAEIPENINFYFHVDQLGVEYNTTASYLRVKTEPGDPYADNVLPGTNVTIFF